MKINIHAGHNPSGSIACGASDYLDESKENRIIVNRLIEMFEDAGHTVYDCTVNNGKNQRDILEKIVAKANNHHVDVDISVHFNSSSHDSGNGKTTGTEVWVYSENSTQKERAAAICEEISKLGFKNRGVKPTLSLYVLKHTISPALLIEVCFVSDKDDSDLYKKVGVESICKAIFKGVTGEEFVETSEPCHIAKAILRTAPNSTAMRIMTLEPSRRLKKVKTNIESDKWTFVKDIETGRTGWVATRLLTDD